MAGIIHLQLPTMRSAVIDNIAAIVKRRITEKTGDGISIHAHHGADEKSRSNELTIEFAIDSKIGEEGFVIEDYGIGIRVTGNDERGLLYGAGKMLRDADYGEGRFELGNWRGSSIPDKKVRGIYLAVHFYNYYHCAPIEEIVSYVEDIALWGYNAIAVWYDMHHFSSIKDPNAVEMLDRLRKILKAAKDIGLQTALMMLGNEAYANSPAELRAEWSGGQNGYFRGLGSHYRVELCPSKPGARELMAAWKREVFETFSDIGIDFVTFGPYDQGGCTCSDCKPWGGNGFVKVSKDGSELARKYLPGVKTVLFGWLFGHHTNGEWELVAEELAEDRSWLDYIMWDYNTTAGTGTDFIFDSYLERNGIPGGLPLIGFPEISMFDTIPFGGWGANPQPDYLQSIWDTAGDLFTGGFPYSEGIYEDMNKAVCSQLYWDRSKTADETIKEYIAYEFSRERADELFKAVKLMQATYVRRVVKEDGSPAMMDRNEPWGEQARFAIDNPDGIVEAYEIVIKADKDLKEKVRRSWRWRMVFLRVVCDYELLHNEFRISERCEEALKELESIYYAENAATLFAPATRRALRSFKVQ